jgi:hypothetical protein
MAEPITQTALQSALQGVGNANKSKGQADMTQTIENCRTQVLAYEDELLQVRNQRLTLKGCNLYRYKPYRAYP